MAHVVCDDCGRQYPEDHDECSDCGGLEAEQQPPRTDFLPRVCLVSAPVLQGRSRAPHPATETTGFRP